ncbi:peptide chain release factor N(5)-glutamine methyltransferase [Thermoleophilia bacterium SCSIO 60948]|nr:peptide chain release factor N(5)-glutamine methyltransferase [Thermoleophilia bacterium SCSIO 60948]
MAGARIGEAIGGAVDALAAAGVDDPRLDAELMLSAIVGLPRAELAISRERELEPSQSRRFADDVRRRLRREPVAYIVGGRGFRNLWLEVDRRVLIPRPETELLVELALELSPSTVLDVGTGSGAIALAVADELPGARVSAYDTSPDAIDVARRNATRLGLADQVELGVTPPVGERFDLLLANLPYIDTADLRDLAPEITDHEPRAALDGGPGGLGPIEALLGELSLATFTAEAIGLEVGDGQARAVAGLLRRAGYERTEIRHDLARIERVVAGWRV